MKRQATARLTDKLVDSKMKPGYDHKFEFGLDVILDGHEKSRSET